MCQSDYDFEVIEESDDWRVIRRRDLHAVEPDHDGQSPLISFYRGRDYIQQHGPYKLPHRIIEAAGAFADKLDLFERYLRIFWGATSFVRWSRRDSEFVTFDTEQWRESVGFTPEALAAWKVDNPGVELADLSEYKAWVEDDVWIIELQRKVPVPTWQAEEVVGGYYGAGYADEQGREMLEAALTEEEEV